MNSSFLGQKFVILLVSLQTAAYASPSVRTPETPKPKTQCEAAAAQAAQTKRFWDLKENGFESVQYPGPEVQSIEVLDPEREFLITLSTDELSPIRPVRISVETRQKSYYCAITRVTPLQE